MIKKITSLCALVLFSTLVSCSSDSDGASTQPNGSISATIDGQPWESVSGGAVASVTNMQGSGSDNLVLQILAARLDQTTLSMQFPIGNLSTGTYTFDGDASGQLSYMGMTTGMFTSAEDNGDFTITITEVNNEARTISGTFSGSLVDMMGTDTIEVTNGVINNVSFGNTTLYSNGSMSLSNNGSAVTINNSELGNSLWMFESDMTNQIQVTGSATGLNNTFGMYALTLPKDATPGTYSLTSSDEYSASFNNDSDVDFTITSGSITIVSHTGNTIVATFNFTATGGGQTVNITNGQLTFEHLD